MFRKDVKPGFFWYSLQAWTFLLKVKIFANMWSLAFLIFIANMNIFVESKDFCKDVKPGFFWNSLQAWRFLCKGKIFAKIVVKASKKIYFHMNIHFSIISQKQTVFETYLVEKTITFLTWTVSQDWYTSDFFLFHTNSFKSCLREEPTITLGKE